MVKLTPLISAFLLFCFVLFCFVLFNAAPPKEDFFSGHLLSPVFKSSLHITITNFLWDHLKAALNCIPVYDMWVL